MLNNIFCLTPTGMRPEGLALLGEYLNTQTYQGPLTWVIVDDCNPATRIPKVREGITLEVIRPSWRWKPGDNTQAASLRAGLEVIPDEAKLVILEDDDIYLPTHLENILNALESFALVGERVTRYYNVATGRHRVIPGTFHASLATTGVGSGALMALRAACAAAKTGIDVRLWRGYQGPKQLLDTNNVVGIKGLPGRPGIGVGHRRNFGNPDRGGMLRQWVGDYADNYGIFREAA